ncbi:MAG: Bax inhibitor-1/YccA family protein [Sphingosinicella sp.]
MANWSDPRISGASPPAATADRAGVAVDAGLRAHMLSVYNYMTSGVLLTGIVALVAALMGISQTLFTGGNILGWIVIFSPLIMVFFLMARVRHMSTGGLQVFFWTFATVMGLSMSIIPLVYNGQSIALAFFATAAAFASLSLYGYTTKRNLSGFGTFFLMGLVGLVVAMLLNAFWLQSPAMDLAISVIGVLIFAGLTVYDTQKIKSIYFEVAGSDVVGKQAILGALTLYLDFINMFQFLLSLIGNRD